MLSGDRLDLKYPDICLLGVANKIRQINLSRLTLARCVKYVCLTPHRCAKDDDDDDNYYYYNYNETLR